MTKQWKKLIKKLIKSQSSDNTYSVSDLSEVELAFFHVLATEIYNLQSDIEAPLSDDLRKIASVCCAEFKNPFYKNKWKKPSFFTDDDFSTLVQGITTLYGLTRHPAPMDLCKLFDKATEYEMDFPEEVSHEQK